MPPKPQNTGMTDREWAMLQEMLDDHGNRLVSVEGGIAHLKESVAQMRQDQTFQGWKMSLPLKVIGAVLLLAPTVFGAVQLWIQLRTRSP